VVGVSADKAESQRKFIDKYGLTFPMIPNTAKGIIAAYGASAVLGLAAARMTFLIGPDGRIARVWPKVNLATHADDVVAAIRELSAG